jgi:Tfp pilus assembly protein PilV
VTPQSALVPLPQHTHRHKHVSVGGFTLLEALVAAVLVIIGLAGAMSAISAGIRAQTAARFYQIAGMLAEQKMTDLENDPDLEAGQNHGDFGNTYEGYTWDSEVVTIADTDDGPKGLYKVSVMVTQDTEPEYGRKATLVTYLLRQG